jgi:hypothetical protein
LTQVNATSRQIGQGDSRELEEPSAMPQATGGGIGAGMMGGCWDPANYLEKAPARQILRGLAYGHGVIVH